MQRRLFEIFSVDFEVTSELLIIHSAFIRYWRLKWECNKAVHELFIEFKEACDSVRREVFYNILIQFGIPMRLVRLLQM
jgi:hypothetical protein